MDPSYVWLYAARRSFELWLFCVLASESWSSVVGVYVQDLVPHSLIHRSAIWRFPLLCSAHPATSSITALQPWDLRAPFPACIFVLPYQWESGICATPPEYVCRCRLSNNRK